MVCRGGHKSAAFLGDINKDQALLDGVFKLLCNSGYGKLIEAVERRTNVSKDEAVVDATQRSAYFDDLEEVWEAYEITKRKRKIKINRSFQVGLAVYQLTKLRIMEFYYDLIHHLIDRNDFEVIQIDTDSLYLALAASQLEDVNSPELRPEFEACRNSWSSWDKPSSRTTKAV